MLSDLYESDHQPEQNYICPFFVATERLSLSQAFLEKPVLIIKPAFISLSEDVLAYLNPSHLP